MPSERLQKQATKTIGAAVHRGSRRAAAAGVMLLLCLIAGGCRQGYPLRPSNWRPRLIPARHAVPAMPSYVAGHAGRSITAAKAILCAVFVLIILMVLVGRPPKQIIDMERDDGEEKPNSEDRSK